MEEALKVLGLRLVRWKSEEMAPMHDNPECVPFVCSFLVVVVRSRCFGTDT